MAKKQPGTELLPLTEHVAQPSTTVTWDLKSEATDDTGQSSEHEPLPSSHKIKPANKQ